MKFKILYFFLILFSADSLLAESSPFGTYNRFVGRTESNLREKIGRPTDEHISPAGNFTDELRRPIYKLFAPDRLDAKVKELMYKEKGGILWIWLEKKGDDWVVIGNAYVPEGLVF